MKKTFSIFLVLAVLVLCAWLYLRQRKQPSEHEIAPPVPLQVSNTVPSVTSSNAQTGATSTSNAFIRPASIDEEHWNQLMLVRRLALEQNQPVEFYARVLDQNEQPIEGAKLTLKLTRTDEKMFETTNFFSRQMGDEVLIFPIQLVSDANGWLQLTGTSGSFVAVWGLTKEGYLSNYPDGNFGGVSYEPAGRRNPSGDIQMTNACNPQKGYIFHLQKTNEPIQGK